MSTNTSRSRFDESRRFTGVYQQMGRVILDADWNEEVRIRATDAARRSADVADGAVGDAFAITNAFLFDPVLSLLGWSGTKADASLLGTVIPEITLARREPASLPHVLRARGYTELRRDLPNTLDLEAVKAPSIGVPPFAASRVDLGIRFDLPTGTSIGTPSLVFIGQGGTKTFALEALTTGWNPAVWTTFALQATEIYDIGQIVGFKLIGLPPQATVYVAGLQLERNEDDAVIRGGNGTMAGAGVMFVDGVRACLPADIELRSQPDYPMPPQPGGGQGSGSGDTTSWPTSPALILSANLVNVTWSESGTLEISTGGAAMSVDLHGLDTLSWSQAIDHILTQVAAAAAAASDESFLCEQFGYEISFRTVATGAAATLTITGTSWLMDAMFGASTVTAHGGGGSTAPLVGGPPPGVIGNVPITPSVLAALEGLTLSFTAPTGQGTCTFHDLTSLDDLTSQIMGAAPDVVASILHFGPDDAALNIAVKPGVGTTTDIDYASSTASSLLGFTSTNHLKGYPYYGDGGGGGGGGGGGSGTVVAYLDLWEIPVTAREDAFLTEPALDGMETASRMRLVQQVKLLLLGADAPVVMPNPTGGGALTTSFATNDARPLRYPTDSFDACRDRCLDTASIATGTGYRGTENVHVRVQVLATAEGAAALWARDNGSTLLMLTEDAAAGATRIEVSPEDALRLRAGDFVVIEDRITRLQPEGGAIGGDASNLHRAELRRLRAVDPSTGALELEAAGVTVGRAGKPLSVGGPLSTDFHVADQAAVRRWDGADLIEAGSRYNLPDGIDLAFSGDPTDYRPGDFWSFTARVHDPDGQSVGKVEPLVEAPPHGPVHRYAPLLRVDMATNTFTDIRRRFLPLHDVRDRLIELERSAVDHGPFTVVVGDGETSFGDVDQDLAHGVTGDDAIQAAIDRVAEGGGTIYIRAGSYTLASPVRVESRSNIRIIGDGDATEIRSGDTTKLAVAGPGGAFLIDSCGSTGSVRLEDLRLVDVYPLSATAVSGTTGVADLTPVALLSPPDGNAPAISAENIGSRAMGQILNAYKDLRDLQKSTDTTSLAALRDLLSVLPRGVVTIADSTDVVVRGCTLRSQDTSPFAGGVFLTGACSGVEIVGCRVTAAAGVIASPLAAYFTDAFLSAHPDAGLALSDLRIDHNDISPPSGRGRHGIGLLDGAFDAVCIRDNQIDHFGVGVEVLDFAELHGNDWSRRLLIAGNRVRDCASVGLQIGADGADVLDNEIACLATTDVLAEAGLFQVGIQVTGQHVRVRGSWISMGTTAPTPVYGVYAGILVGDGLEDGASPARPVFDVEIGDNRVEGAAVGDGTGAAITGVLISGPQPIYDVRIRGNELRNLGDAAVRVLGTSVAVGRIRVEDNRIEQVCLAEMIQSSTAFKSADVQALGRLAPELTINEAWWNPAAFIQDPQLSLTDAKAMPAIDAALRALERATLRGAVALCRVEGADVRGNSIHSVGYYTDGGWPTDWPGIGTEIRLGGVAVVGGNDVVVEGNRIEDVRAPFHGITDPEGVSGSSAPTASDALAAITTSTDVPATVQASLHDAAAGLHRKLLDVPLDIKTRNPTTVDSTLLDLMNAATAGLDALVEQIVMANDSIAGHLKSTLDDLRVTYLDLPHALLNTNIARHLVANLAYRTAPDDDAKFAWEQVELLNSPVARPDAITMSEAFDDIKRKRTTLLANVPSESLVFTHLDADLALSAITDDDIYGIIADLSDLASYRDEVARGASLAATGSLGYKGDLISSLAKDIRSQINALTSASSISDALRSSVDSLVNALNDVGADLAAYVEADFLAIDRNPPVITSGTQGNLVGTLDRVTAWIESPSTTSPTTDGAYADAAARLSKLRATYAIIQVAIQYIEDTATESATLPSHSFTISDEVFSTLFWRLKRLEQLTTGEATINTKIDEAIAATVTATSAAAKTDISIRESALATIRTKLSEMLADASSHFAASAGANPTGSPSDSTARRLAGLGALLLTLRATTPNTSPWPSGLDLVATHVVRAMSEMGEGSDVITLMSKAIDDARRAIEDSTTDSTVWAKLEELAAMVDTLAAKAVRRLRTTQMVAAATLLHAALLAINASDTDINPMQAQCYLDAHRLDVSASIVDRILGYSDADKVRAGIRDALLAIALGETSDVQTATEVAFPAPESADGMFAAAVEEQLSIGQNTILSALLGITVLGNAGHVLAELPPNTPGELLIEVIGNRLRGCSIGALEVVPRSGPGVIVVIEDNQAGACADLGAGSAALQRGGVGGALQIANSQAVARFAGSGDLLIHGNVFQGNGHGQPSALLHEILVDWRGNVVVRGNTVRHSGGGAGGVALLILTQVLDANPANAAALVGKFSLTPALFIEPPPPSSTTQSICQSKTAPAPWYAGTLAIDGSITRVSAQSSYYIKRAQKTLATSIKSFLAWEKVPLRSLLSWYPIERTSVQVEGNHVQSTGPALLVLGAPGNAITTASIVGNELRSSGRAGAVYLRRTDATVFTGNQCESLASINVVVMYPDDAPVVVSGNAILGAQPVSQIDPKARERNYLYASINTNIPDYRSSSLVVVGGTRVVAVGNVTTAGALILGADQTTELNN